MTQAAFLDYRVQWRAGESRPGKHTARQAGRDGDFRGWRPFWQAPDAQRIDIRRSMLDPWGGVVVRQTAQRSSITVILAADLSRSMAPAGGASAYPGLAALCEAAARSAARAGDAFGFIGFDETVRSDMAAPPSRRRGSGSAAALRDFRPRGRSARGIADVASHLPPRRCLVLLVSDFLMDLAAIDAAMLSLGRHDVAPVVLDAAPVEALPRAGLLRLRDAETGGTRLVAMRPSLHRRCCAQALARRQALDLLFRRHGCAAFHAGETIDIAALSRHLLER